MKTKPVILCASALVMVLCATAWAEEKSSKPQTKSSCSSEKQKATAQIGKDETRVVTGSRLPRRIRESGGITDSPSPLLIINRNAIERSGAADLRQLLVRKGLQR